jgi:transcriptional regulator with XRE-family HTH domain
MHQGNQRGGPVGAQLAAWRARRGLSVAEVAARCGLASKWIAELESGEEWLDRRGHLAALSSALRLDPVDLTGQPYPPAGPEHAVARAAAFHLRRAIVADLPASAMVATVEELAARTDALDALTDSGDERGLAEALPGLIRDGDALMDAVPIDQRDRVVDLRVGAHLAAAGLLRRLGYRDLAWLLLHRARAGGSELDAVLVEEVRLLLDMGLPEHALTRVDAEANLPLLTATAHAMAGRHGVAARLLRRARSSAEDAAAAARVTACQVVVAVECGEVEEAAERARSVDRSALAPADLVSLAVSAATAEARRWEIGRAAAWLREAEKMAPLRLRLDPFARELLAVLPSRASDATEAAVLEQMAGRAGLG